MDFQKEQHTFRGLDGDAGFRHGKEYALEMTRVAETKEPADHIINPVSKLWAHHTVPEVSGGHCINDARGHKGRVHPPFSSIDLAVRDG